MYLFRSVLFLLLCNTVISAKQPEGRAHAKEIKVPDSINYTVHNYRKEKVLRANQIGLAYLKDRKQEKLPVVIFIHGGGWSKGDKDQMAYLALNYAKAGFVGVTISYRLLSEAPYPAQVQDAKEALRFIKSLAKDHPIDINRIGVCGYSAGAHLALLIALSEGEAWYDSGKYGSFDSSVRCAVGISSPIDFDTRIKEKNGKLKILSAEQQKDSTLVYKCSPLNLMSKDQVPILLFHGDKDALVPAYHYKNFAKKAKTLGIKNLELNINPQGDHTYFFRESKKLHPIMMNFFKKQLM